jgi:hypothetical protein
LADFVDEEACSSVAQLDERFDIIQVSFIDTFAAQRSWSILAHRELLDLWTEQ